MKIHARIHAAIQPQLDRADELLDQYTEGLPQEVWEPIAFKAAADHYRQVPLRVLAGSFADAITRFDEGIRQIMQVALYPAFHDPHEPVPPVPAQTLTRH